MPLYVDDAGRSIVTNSMITTFRRCHKQAEYKYVHRLKPRLLGGPLKRGTWVHLLLEEHSRGGDWMAIHAKLSKQFDQMFDEEKDHYGDMPTEIKRIMLSYFWHYKKDPWKHLDQEFELEATLPSGQVLRAKVDELVETQFGLYLVDHKTNKTLPKLRYQTLDTQSPTYLWLAKKNGLKVQGFIWNYIRWKAPTMPALVYKGTARERLSTRTIDTDYPTFHKALRLYELDSDDYSAQLARLKSMRYAPGEPQNSPFFLRYTIEKQPDLLKRVLKEISRSGATMDTYDFTDRDAVERTVGRHCEWMCSYSDLCGAELMGHNTKPLIKQNFTIGDPMSYYHDKAGDEGDKE